MAQPDASQPSFFQRLGTALAAFGRALGNPAFARQVADLLNPPATPPKPLAPPAPPAPVKPVEVPPERRHAAGLAMLALLQREGRLLDFLQEDMAAFADAEIGAAARVVHAGCRKALQDHLTIEAVRKESEGDRIQLPAGFDAQRIRLTGNVSGQPPFTGTLKHHGWVVTSVRLPNLSEALDPRVIAPAEVDL